MQPNAPLTTLTPRIFGEGSGLASSRDARTVGQSWKNVRAISGQANATTKALAAVQADLRRLRRVRPGGFVPQTFTQTPVAGPFSIYQGPVSGVGVSINAGGSGYTGSPNGIQVPGGSVLQVSGGTGTPAQITVVQVDSTGAALSAVVTSPGNYSVPPTFPASTTTLSGGGSGCAVTILSLVSTSANYTCQIRSGCIAARAQFDPSIESNYDGGTGIIIQTPSQGNYEFVFALDLDGNFEDQFNYAGNDADTDPYFEIVKNSVVTLNTGASIATPKLIYGILPDGTNVSYGQIYIPYSASNQVASFWIQIVDQQTPLSIFTAEVWGIMVDPQSGFYPAQYPQGPNIIPIGSYSPQATGGEVYQVLSGNLVNRWPAMKLPVTGGTSTLLGLPEIFRGYWHGDSLSGQMFYDGDVVIDDTSGITIQASTSTAYRKWQYVAGCNTEMIAPSANTGNWQIVGCVINP